MKKVNSRRTPVYRDAGFYLENAEKTRQAFVDEQEPQRDPELYIYSRYRNPTVVAAEEQIMQLEESAWALLTQSGMSAVDVALSIFQKGPDTGNWLFFSEIYGGTNSFIDQILIKRRNITINRFYPENGNYNLEKLEAFMEEARPALIYFEVISNPMLMVSDALAICTLAKKYGARVIIDNTFSTSYLWKPLKAGADLVIHSATKYFAGHGNVTAGVVCGNESTLLKEGLEYRKLAGHMLSPDDAYRLDTQIRTFSLRFARQCLNAQALSRLLEEHPVVETTLYPGLASHPSHKIAKKLFGNKGYGAMVTFSLTGKDPAHQAARRDAFIDKLSGHIDLVPTLGDSDTILLPVEPVWGDKYPLPGTIRLSAGIENTDQLTDLIGSALEAVRLL